MFGINNFTKFIAGIYLNLSTKNTKSATTSVYVLITLILNSCASNQLANTVKVANKSITSYSTSLFGLADITTFDVYVNGNKIHLLTGGKNSANGKEIGIRYTQSKDGGAAWSNTKTVANVPALINNRGNDVQIAAKDESILVLWQAKGELPGMGPLQSAFSTDNGISWNKGKNPAVNNAGDQSHSDLMADSQGRFHAAWLEDPEEKGYQSLRYANTDNLGQSWSKAATLDDSTCSCCWNSFSLSPGNKALNLYFRDMKPRDMELIRSLDNGDNWQRISTVGDFGWQFDGCPHVGGALAYSNENPTRLHALSWTGLEGKSGLYFLTSDDDGKHWSKPMLLGKQALHGDIAAYQDTVVAVWDEMRDEGSIIYTTTSTDNGKTWTAAKKLSEAKHNATHPRLANTNGRILALWTEKPANQPSQLVWMPINY